MKSLFVKNSQSIMEDYFENHSQWNKLAPKIKKALFEESIEVEKYDFVFLSTMGLYLDFFPTWNGNAINRMEEISPANQVEERIIKEQGYPSLIDTRDHFIFMRAIDETYLNDMQPPENMFIKGREFIQHVLTNHYLGQVLNLQKSLIEVINTVIKLISGNWKLLLSKYKRGVYYDEWGIRHDEAWIRELRYFSDNMIVPSVKINKLLLLLNLKDETIRPLFENLTADNHNEYMITIGCTENYNEIRNIVLGNDKNKQKKLIEECAFNICNLCINFQNLYASEDYQIRSFKESIPLKGSGITEDNNIESTNQKEGVVFEFRIKEILENIGYKIIMTPTTGDQGVDIIATRNGKKYAIQCKYYSGQVGNAAVQEVIAGRIFYDCDYACVVTDSTFTPSAYQLAAKAGVIMCANENLDSLK